MTVHDNVRTKLEALLKEGSLPKSSCTGRALRAFLKPLLDSGVVVHERAGAGQRLVVCRPTELRSCVQRDFPNTLVSADAPSRVASVARFRDSKVLTGDTPDIVVLRAWSDEALWCDGQPVPAAEATSAHGVFSFVVSRDSQYELRSPCALVEGPVMLLNFELLRPRPELDAVLYGGGRLSRRVLAWLAGQKAPGFRLVHFPDYDPVGLREFMRLRTALGARASLHVPENLAERFTRFGKRKLLQSRASQKLQPRVRSFASPEVKVVLELIDRHNAGLEQEELLVASFSPDKP